MSERWAASAALFKAEAAACAADAQCACGKFHWCPAARAFRFGDWRDDALAAQRAKPGPNGYGAAPSTE